MANGDIYQMSAVWTAQDVAWANVYYWKVIDETGTLDPEGDAISALVGTLLTEQRKITSFQTTLDCVLSRKVFPQTEPTRVENSGVAGSVIAPMLPSNQAVIVSHRSKPVLRQNYGRVFVAGIPETWVDRGRVVQTEIVEFVPYRLALTTVQTDTGRDYRAQHFSKSLGTYQDIFDTTVRPVPTKLRNRTPRLCPIS